MTQEEWKAAAADRIKTVIDLIFRGEYGKLPAVAKISPSWCGGGTQEDGFRKIGDWLAKMFALWCEEYGKEYVVDAFDERQLEIYELGDDKARADYHITSSGEEIDEFWFEFDIEAKDGVLTLTFNVNA